MNAWQIITLSETGLGAVACVVFCFWYGWKLSWSWPKTEHGWFMLTLGVVLGVLFGLISTTRLFGQWWGREGVILLVYTGLIIITFWMPRLVYVSYRDSETPDNQE